MICLGGFLYGSVGGANSDMKMKSILMVLTCLFLYGCQPGGKEGSNESSAPVELIGEWHGEEMSLDGNRYTGFYAFDIEKNGEFSLYDAEAGNPGIEGKINQYDGESLKMKTRSEADFDVPAEWSGLNHSDTLLYEIKGEKLYMSYKDKQDKHTLVFSKSIY